MTRRPGACRCTRLDTENQHRRGCPLFVPPLFTSGKTTHDPHPWRIVLGPWRGTRTEIQFPESEYDPRSEFDNHNPILVELRRKLAAEPIPLAQAVQWFRNWFRFGKAEQIPATRAQSDHAWNVLTKLANIYKED